jgi:pyrophosphatase PpaX
MPIKAVLFDLDGTLLDSIDGIVTCFTRVLADFVPGHSWTRDQMIMKIGEPVPRQMLDFSGGRQDLVDPMVAAYRKQMGALLESFPLYPGTRETLTTLQQLGFRTGLVTSKSRGPVEVSLNRHTMHGWFDVIVTADDTSRHKPLPDPLLLAAQKIAVTPGDILYIGDSVHDIRCAHAAGSLAGAAYWGPFPRNTLDELSPAYSFESLPEIIRILSAPGFASPRRP